MSLTAHLPALQVVVPLLAAPAALLLRRPALAYALALAAAWSAFACALALAGHVAAHGTWSYAIGNWPPPWGIEYRIDALGAFMLLLVSGIGALVLPHARSNAQREVAEHQHTLFYTMYLLCLAGLLGMVATGDAFNVFVFMEISSLSAYVLIALGRDRRALMASYQYLIMGTIGATFFVIGVGLLYLNTGSLNIADLARRVGQVQGNRPVLAALGFITVGLALKLAMFPLHQWLPNAYAYAPTPVTALLAGTGTKVAVYVLLRFWFGIFGHSPLFVQLPMEAVMLVLGVGGMFVASAVAIFQADLRRLFAWSSVGQLGYIVLGLSFGTVAGTAASVTHLLNHGISKAAVFVLLGAALRQLGSTELTRVQGMGRTMPWTSAGLVVAGLSLIGVPGTAGFVSKWALLAAALEKGQWWLVFAIVASSLLAVAYVWRFVEAAYLMPPAARADAAPLPRPAVGTTFSAAVLVGACVWFGMDTQWTLRAANAAAAMLMGAGR